MSAGDRGEPAGDAATCGGSRATVAWVSRRGWVLFAAMCVIWGVPYLLIKVAVADVSPAALVWMRTAIGAILLLPLAAARGNLRPLLPYWRAIVVYSFVEVALPWLLLSEAEVRLSSSLTGLLVAAVPLTGAVLSRLSGGAEQLDRRRVAGLIVGLAGVAALLGLNVTGGDLGAVGEIALVTVCYATGPMIISRRLSNLPAVGVVAASMILSALAYTPIGVAQMPASLPPARVIAAVVILGVACTAIAFLLFFALIAEVGPIRATVITYVNPAVALALGVALLGEPLTVGACLGFGLILLGSFLATRRSVPPPGEPAERASAVVTGRPPAAVEEPMLGS